MNAQQVGVPPAEVGVESRYVLPGDVASASSPCRFVTVLGSCVAVCMYDSAAQVGGINHYLLPGSPVGDESNPWRWSDAAIAELLRQMLGHGAALRRIRAKVFGGAQISPRNTHCGFRIGERNVESATALLGHHGVQVVSQSVGGHAGRKLVFESHTGNAWIKVLGQGNP